MNDLNKDFLKKYQKVSLGRENRDHQRMREILLDTDTLRLLHASIGICGEAGELIEAYANPNLEIDRINVIEEIGDILFYIVIVCDVTGFSFQDFCDPPIKIDTVEPQRLVHSIMINSSHLMDQMKKSVFYCRGTEPNKLFPHLKTLSQMIRSLIGVIDSDIREVLSKNDQKLAQRTGTVFSKDKVLNRNLEKERDELEK